MKNKFAMALAIAIFATGLETLPSVGQENDLGQQFSKMSSAELWAKVMECEDRKQLQSLFDQIPISVIGKQALTELKRTNQGTKFGRTITHVLWPEAGRYGEPSVYCTQLFKMLHWSDLREGFELEARIFDVRASSVILQKEDDSLIEVPIKNLPTDSLRHIGHFLRIRPKFLERLPANKNQLIELITSPVVDDWPNKAAAILAIKNMDGIIDDKYELFLELFGLRARKGQAFIPGREAFAISSKLPGVASDKPAGAILMFDGETPVIVYCVPVSDFDALLKTLSANGKVWKDGKFAHLTLPSGEELVAIADRGYAYFANDKSILEEPPLTDPAQLFTALANQYMASVSVKLEKFPKSRRDQAILLVQDGPVFRLNNFGDDFFEHVRSPYGFALVPMAFLVHAWGGAIESTDVGSKITSEILNEADEITVGWAVDKKGQRSFLDFSFTAQHGTRLEQRIVDDSPDSRYAGFVRENAAITFHYAGSFFDLDKDLLTKTLGNYASLNVNDRDLVDLIGKQSLKVLDSCFENGNVDIASSIILDGGTIDLVLGAYVADGRKVEESIMELIAQIESKFRERVEVELNAATYDRVHFHKLLVSIPEGQKQTRKMFGEKAEFVFGIGQKSVYFGVGNKAVESIKLGIERSQLSDGLKLSGMQLMIDSGSILQFLPNLGQDKMMDEMIDSLKKIKKDAIIISLKAKEDAQRFRIEIQEGILRLIGVIILQQSSRGF